MFNGYLSQVNLHDTFFRTGTFHIGITDYLLDFPLGVKIIHKAITELYSSGSKQTFYISLVISG